MKIDKVSKVLLSNGQRLEESDIDVVVGANRTKSKNEHFIYLTLNLFSTKNQLYYSTSHCTSKIDLRTDVIPHL